MATSDYAGMRYGRTAVPLAFDALAERAVDPPGTFDNAGRWYPSEDWEASCCSSVRGPSRSYPYAYLTHCRTQKHVSTLWAEKPKSRDTIRRFALRGTVREEPRRACADGVAYKRVALVAGQLVSVFDGSPWPLGHERQEAPRRGHNGGFYVYETPQAARRAPFPRGSAHANAPQLVVECRVAGAYCRYKGGKLAFSRVRPVRVTEAIVAQ